MAIRVTNLTTQLLVQETPQRNLSQSLVLTQELTVLIGINGGYIEPLEDHIQFVQYIELEDDFVDSTIQIEIFQQIQLQEIDARVLGADLSDTLDLIQEVARIHALSDEISFTQNFGFQTGDTDPSQQIAFAHSITSSSSVFRRNLAHEGVISHSFSYYIPAPCATKAYNRFDGEGTGAGIEEKRLDSPGTFTLETIGSPKTILQLRNPETDNRDRLGFSRINRETRGGELNFFSDPIWGKVNTLLFTIVALKKEKITALQSFLQDTLGLEVKLHDWTGTVWNGVITTPGEVATEDGKNAWAISFEFEGIPYPGQAPDVGISFSQITSAAGSIWNRSPVDDVGLTDEVVINHIEVPLGVGNIDGPSNLSTTGNTLPSGEGLIDGASLLASDNAIPIPQGMGVVDGPSNLSAVIYLEPIGAGEIDGPSDLNAAGYLEPVGVGAIDGSSILIAASTQLAEGSGSIDGASALVATGDNGDSTGLIDGASVMMATGYVLPNGVGAIDGESVLTGTGTNGGEAEITASTEYIAPETTTEWTDGDNTPDKLLDLAGLTDATGIACGAYLDLGEAPRTLEYEFTLHIDGFASGTALLGETIDLYVIESNDGSNFDGRPSTAPTASTEGTITVDQTRNAKYVGSVRVTTTTEADNLLQGRFITKLSGRYVAPVIINRTGGVPTSSSDYHFVQLTPIPVDMVI